MIQFENIFEMGWNHQLENDVTRPNDPNGKVAREACLKLALFQGSPGWWITIFCVDRIHDLGIAPENWCLENEFPFGKAYFHGRTVSFREPIPLGPKDDNDQDEISPLGRRLHEYLHWDADVSYVGLCRP